MTLAPPVEPKETTKLYYDQIVPGEYQDELIHLGEEKSRIEWRIGDIANRLYREAKTHRSPVTQQDVYAAVGYFSRCSASAVEYYARTADFFKPDERGEYDQLPFSMYAYAKQYGREEWRGVMEYALEGDATGAPRSVEAVRASYPTVVERDGERETPDPGYLEISNIVRDLKILVRRITTNWGLLPEPSKKKLVIASRLLKEVAQEMTDTML